MIANNNNNNKNRVAELQDAHIVLVHIHIFTFSYDNIYNITCSRTTALAHISNALPTAIDADVQLSGDFLFVIALLANATTPVKEAGSNNKRERY